MALFSAVCIHASADTPSADPAELRSALVEDSKKYVGTPYKYGATGPDAFDCSGFIYTVAHESTGYQLPRTSKALYSFVKVIPEKKLEKGDIVFFRTTGSSSISHAGIYIGNKQFIHAVSDGPNTGVIISSLNESYWRSVYAGSGQFLPSASGSTDDSGEEAETVPVKSESESPRNENARSSSGTVPEFVRHLVFDASVAVDWSFFTSNRFLLNYRGVPLSANLRVDDWPLQPGIGTMIRFNYGVGAVQIPIVLSMTVNEYVRVYAGPVITLGTPQLPGKSDDIKASIFPGIIGVSWQTPSFTKGTLKVTLVQDVSYTIFNDTDGSALSMINSLASGLVFSTGVRVTFPFSWFIH